MAVGACRGGGAPDGHRAAALKLHPGRAAAGAPPRRLPPRRGAASLRPLRLVDHLGVDVVRRHQLVQLEERQAAVQLERADGVLWRGLHGLQRLERGLDACVILRRRLLALVLPPQLGRLRLRRRAAPLHDLLSARGRSCRFTAEATASWSKATCAAGAGGAAGGRSSCEPETAARATPPSPGASPWPRGDDEVLEHGIGAAGGAERRAKPSTVGRASCPMRPRSRGRSRGRRRRRRERGSDAARGALVGRRVRAVVGHPFDGDRVHVDLERRADRHRTPSIASRAATPICSARASPPPGGTASVTCVSAPVDPDELAQRRRPPERRGAGGEGAAGGGRLLARVADAGALMVVWPLRWPVARKASRRVDRRAPRLGDRRRDRRKLMRRSFSVLTTP